MEATSTEGEPVSRFRKRGAEFPDRKFLLESTPSIAGRSAIETGRQQSTDHRYHVPCPHCVKFQTLEFGDGSGPGMIHWEKTPNGQDDRGLARRTAHYVCLHCEGRIDDIHRPWMMNKGVWVPKGCTVDHEKAMEARQLPADDMSWLIGTPVNWGSDYGSQISVFYALFHGWGDIVDDFLSKCKKPKTLQQWVNEDKGETWEVKRTKTTPEKVGERLKVETPRGVVPKWVKFLTCTMDRQAADGSFVKWVVVGHGENEKSHVVDYGAAKTLDETWATAARRQFPRTGGGLAVTPILCAVDSGWDTKKTYDFCNGKHNVFACKGSSTDMAGKPFRLAEVEKGDHEGQILFTVNTDYWESDLQAALDERLPGEFGSMSLCSEAEKDIEFLTELCNGVISDSMDSRNNAKLLWVRKDENIPNDWRDAIRYGKALAKLVEESGGVPQEVERIAEQPKQRQPYVREVEQSNGGGWIRRRSS